MKLANCQPCRHRLTCRSSGAWRYLRKRLAINMALLMELVVPWSRVIYEDPTPAISQIGRIDSGGGQSVAWHCRAKFQNTQLHRSNCEDETWHRHLQHRQGLGRSDNHQ